MLDKLFEGIKLKNLSEDELYKRETEFLKHKIGLNHDEIVELFALDNKKKVIGFIMRAYKIGHTDGKYNIRK
ncbi:hypothetical protein [Niallia taxi]|uniref:hypothetical protein n=1 Tax=Niallia taxi TaxID=2499688 RepID=UPI0030097E3E